MFFTKHQTMEQTKVIDESINKEKMNLIDGQKDCPCTNLKCPRKTNCAECVKFHSEKNNRPFCER
jgi:hypothetical protein